MVMAIETRDSGIGDSDKNRRIVEIGNWNDDSSDSDDYEQLVVGGGGGERER